MKCPKCGRELKASGEAFLGDERLDVYQCDECLMPLDLGGETMDVALTFAVGPGGQYVDPADPTRPINLN